MIPRIINATVLRRLSQQRSTTLFRSFASVKANETIVLNKVEGSRTSSTGVTHEKESIKVEACGDVKDDDDEMEKEQMFVEPHESFEFRVMEWGGPRRGGRLPEPTRYGDWERKGRASDF